MSENIVFGKDDDMIRSLKTSFEKAFNTSDNDFRWEDLFHVAGAFVEYYRREYLHINGINPEPSFISVYCDDCGNTLVSEPLTSPKFEYGERGYGVRSPFCKTCYGKHIDNIMSEIGTIGDRLRDEAGLRS